MVAVRFKPNLSRSRFGRYKATDSRLPGTKAELVDLLASKGLKLVVERTNVGAWNESRDFKVNGIVLDAVTKSSKPDWDYMIKEVEKMK